MYNWRAAPAIIYCCLNLPIESITVPEWGNIKGMEPGDCQNLAGVDPYDGKIHWYTVDNVDDTHEHTGTFSDSTF